MSRVTRTNSRIIPERKIVYVGLTPWMHDMIAELAKADDRSMSFIIRHFISTHPRVQEMRSSSAPQEAERDMNVFNRVFDERDAQREAATGANA